MAFKYSRSVRAAALALFLLLLLFLSLIHIYLGEHPFSLSYGVNLPSSLTTLLPLALESSS